MDFHDWKKNSHVRTKHTSSTPPKKINIRNLGHFSHVLPSFVPISRRHRELAKCASGVQRALLPNFSAFNLQKKNHQKKNRIFKLGKTVRNGSPLPPFCFIFFAPQTRHSAPRSCRVYFSTKFFSDVWKLLVFGCRNCVIAGLPSELCAETFLQFDPLKAGGIGAFFYDARIIIESFRKIKFPPAKMS